MDRGHQVTPLCCQMPGHRHVLMILGRGARSAHQEPYGQYRESLAPAGRVVKPLEEPCRCSLTEGVRVLTDDGESRPKRRCEWEVPVSDKGNIRTTPPLKCWHHADRAPGVG